MLVSDNLSTRRLANRETAVFKSLMIIEESVTKKLTVENIAGSIYLSKYHYQRLFREIVGESVMEYVTKRRLTLAGSELLATDKTILDIALDFGYNSHEGFTRAFKAYMGVTPTQYRRYGLAAISQKQIKERFSMTHSQNTDEIIKELNEFIAKAKDTVNEVRNGPATCYTPFWENIADRTQRLADSLQNSLNRITDMEKTPDKITVGFTIIKLMEDASFETNLICFNVNLMLSRGNEGDTKLYKPFCERFKELAKVSSIKAGRVTKLFNELFALIMEEMRGSALTRLSDIVAQGKNAVDSLQGYLYIKYEVSYLVDQLSRLKPEQVTVQYLEDTLFKLDIIAFAADMDIFRRPDHKGMFEGIKGFRDSLLSAIDYFSSIVIPKDTPVAERPLAKHFTDISFQGNILAFYINGEVSDEKLGRLLTQEQKDEFGSISTKLRELIQYCQSATDTSAFKVIADMLYEISDSLVAQADSLEKQGGAVRFLAGECRALGDSINSRS